MCFIFILPIIFHIYIASILLKMAQKSTSKHLKRAKFSGGGGGGGGGGGMPPDPPSKCVLCTHILKIFRALRRNGLSTFNLLPTPLG